MACRPLKSANIENFKTSVEVLRAIQVELSDLKSIAAETNFQDEIEAKQFSRNVLFLKMYFEHYQRILENE